MSKDKETKKAEETHWLHATPELDANHAAQPNVQVPQLCATCGEPITQAE